MTDWGNSKYIPVAAKKAKAAASLKRLRSKNQDLEPILISGRKLACTWWGQAWNNNLERYADYSNRIDRGRSYIRQGSVLDLKIAPGEVRALVQGSRRLPYQVTIAIAPLGDSIWQAVVNACAGQIDSLQDLLEGRFPESLVNLFTAHGKGLFPTPKEIHFTCSCPDWASMCKHVAAALYGVGVRLDQAPDLLFTLRQVDMHHLISQTIQQKTDALTNPGIQKSTRILDDHNLAEMFGIGPDVGDAGKEK